jgi:hypothetical protein
MRLGKRKPAHFPSLFALCGSVANSLARIQLFGPSLLPFGLLKQAVHVSARIEDHQVIHPLANAAIANRQIQLFGNRHGDAALGRAIQLGQHQTGHLRRFQELTGLAQSVLAGHGVYDQQRLVRRFGDFARGDAFHLFKFSH